MPLASAASGSITRPEVTSAEVRNIKDLTDICTNPSPLGA
jgi:hypothetical protein